ncbi:MAG TPA: ABC transporter permease, partial [Thermomicrobiales bacterium]|nr:ABC transporter permease [Thermomicrobiales bacterium]
MALAATQKSIGLGGEATVLDAAARRGRPSALRRLLDQDPVAVGAIVVVLAIALLALLAPVLPLADPDATSLSDRLLPPLTGGHLLGTDQLGRDLLSRIVWGARVSITVGIVAAAMAGAVGAMVGIVGGLFGGAVDHVLMRLMDVILAFPYVLLAIALVAALGPGLFNAMIAVAVVNVAFYARNIRGSVLALRNQGFVDAARALGAPG